MEYEKDEESGQYVVTAQDTMSGYCLYIHLSNHRR